jgi:hypothetical protein
MICGSRSKAILCRRVIEKRSLGVSLGISKCSGEYCISSMCTGDARDWCSKLNDRSNRRGVAE